jgi:uncharacterized membrane protein HdeD (DUF308 family)
MALINCPECQKEISDQATACPHCGHPMKRPTTIEATGKKWKGIQLFSGIAFIIGIFWCIGDCSSMMAGSQETSSSGWVWFIVLGFLGFVIGRIGAWWHHR